MTFVRLINCVIDDALLKTMPDQTPDQALLHFIDIMILLDLLQHFSPHFCSQTGSDLCYWLAKCLVK